MSLPESKAPPWQQTVLQIVRRGRQRWRMLLVCSGAGALAGTVTALVLPSYYSSGASFQGENTPPSSLPGSVAGLAAQVGILQLGSQNNAQYFGDLLSTDAVLRPVVRASVPWRQGFAPLSTVYGVADEPAAQREFDAVRVLRKSLSVDVNVRTSVVRFDLEARTPELAFALAETTLNVLDRVLIDFRKSRATAEQSFSGDRADQAQRELRAAEDSLTVFSERNRAIANSPSLQMREAELRRNIDVAQQVYLQLRLLAEQAGVQAVRNTPTITVIDQPVVPVRRSRPQRRRTAALGLAAGFALAIVVLLLDRRALQPG
jgi:uncharacterized protein involved in exopolysaccharide biosynthesis